MLRNYQPLVVPGLLQTEDYARVILSMRPDSDKDDLDVQVAARLARQAVLERAKLRSVIDEGVMHRNIGGGKVMRTQLCRLAVGTAGRAVAIRDSKTRTARGWPSPRTRGRRSPTS